VSNQNTAGGTGPLGFVAAIIGLYIVIPLLLIVPMSFNTTQSIEFPPKGFWLGYYAKFFQSESWLAAIVNSTVIAAAVAVLTMLLVVPATFAMVRHQFRGKAVVRLVLLLPIIVPSIVMALGYYIYYGKVGLNHTMTGVVLAHTAGAVPVCFLILSAVMKGLDRNLERAAISLGASQLQTFFLVTLPLLRVGFLSAALFSFVHSFDEAVISLFISGRSVMTLPRKMFDSMSNEADPVIAVVSTLLMLAVLLGCAGTAIFKKLRTR
jgi:putative spermidine/putrescine transport system permease protein